MKYDIFIKNKDQIQKCLEGKSLMAGLCCTADLVPKGCHNGACGLCRIQVISGDYSKTKMNKKFISDEDEKKGILLACRVFPKGDMQIEFLPRAISKKREKEVYVFGQNS